MSDSAALAHIEMFGRPRLARPWPFGGLERWSYDLIMADPPWRFELYSEAGEGKSAQAHYQTMTMDEIAALPVRDLGRPDCVLWLWCTWPMLPQQIEIVAAWGFRFVTGGAWVKTTSGGKIAFGTGYRLRSACEPFLIGVSGNPETARDVRNVVMAKAREHSAKPEAAFEAAARLMARPGGQANDSGPALFAEPVRQPTPRLVELFSRRTRAGWDTWGNERGKLDGMA